MANPKKPGKSRAGRSASPRKRVVAKTASDKSAATEERSPKKRGPGRPKKHERVITPNTLREIGKMWCENQAICDIADHFGVSTGTISYHLSRTLRPAWRSDLVSDVEDVLERIRHLAEEAYIKWRADGDAECLRTLRWAIEQVAKIRGFYSPERIDHTADGGYRVAGRGREELAEAMLQRLALKIEALRRQQERTGEVLRLELRDDQQMKAREVL
jgi:hypothetical protein